MSGSSIVKKQIHLMSSYVVIMMVRRNDNDDTYVCNTRRNGNVCQGGA